MGRDFPFIVRVDLLKLHEIASCYGGKNTVDIMELPNVEFVFGELSKMRPKTFAAFQYNEQGNWHRIVVDILQVEISKICRKEKSLEAMRKKIHKNLVHSIAHESAHWYMYHADRKMLVKSGRTLKEVSRICISVIVGALIIMAGAVIFEGYSHVRYATWIANVLHGVYAIFLGFGFYAGLWLAQKTAKEIVYVFCKTERFARRFEHLAKKDPRWNEVVFVDWK